jgi:hypothetical protein
MAEKEERKRERHGMKNTKIYDVWANMKSRCFYQKDPCYKHYGGRGITICKEWNNSFLSFYNWAINNGYEQGLELDRIDNNGNYEPNNCHWVTHTQNGRNRRTNVLISYNGQTHCINEWAELLGINKSTLYYRFRRGWSAEAALNALLEGE